MKKSAGLVIGVIILAAVAAGVFYFQTQAVQLTAADILPQGALVYSRYVDVEKNLEKFKNSSFWQKAKTIDLAKVMKKTQVPDPQIEMFQSFHSQISEFLNSEEFKQLFGQEIVFAVYPTQISTMGLETIKEAASNIFLITRLRTDVKVAEFLNGLLSKFRKDTQIQAQDYKRHKIYVVEIPEIGGSLAYTIIKDLLVIGFTPKAAQAAIDVFNKEKSPLAQEEAFQKVSKQFLNKADKTGFFNLEMIVNMFKGSVEKLIAAEPAQVRDMSRKQTDQVWNSLAGFKFVSLSASYEDIIRQKMVLQFDKEKMNATTRKFYECKPKANGSLDFVPQGIIWYQWNGCLDAASYWARVKEEMGQSAAASPHEQAAPSPEAMIQGLENMLKLSIEHDLIPAFGDEAGGFLANIDTSDKYPLPQFVLFVKVANKASMDKVLGTLSTQPYIVLQHEDYGNTTIQYMAMPMNIKMEPGYCYLGDYLVLASHRDLLKRCVDTSKDSGLSLAKSEYFKAINFGLTEANNSVFFMRLDELVVKIREIAEWGWRFMQDQVSQQSAFLEGSKKRREDITKDIEQKNSELNLMQEKMQSLEHQIDEANAQAQDTTDLLTQKSDLQLQIKAKEQAINLAQEQKKDMEDMIAQMGQTKPAPDPAMGRTLFDEAVFPFLEALRTFPTIGSWMRFVGEDALESMMYIKTE